MSRISSLSDFGLDGAAGVLYTQYDPAAPYLLDRAASIRGRFAQLSTKILIAGCGPGSMVKHLTDLGYTQVFGVDASADLINHGKTLYPAIASRLLIGDCMVSSQMTAVRRAAGLSGQNRFGLLITDDLLTVMANLTEVQQCLTVLRATGSTLLHVLWPIDPDPRMAALADQTLLWYSVPTEWQQIIGNGEWVVNAITGQVYGANGELVP